jgi:hypothetical protein
VFIAFSPYPTSKPYEVLPRYFSRFQLVDNEEIHSEHKNQVDFSLNKYFEAVNFNF